MIDFSTQNNSDGTSSSLTCYVCERHPAIVAENGDGIVHVEYDKQPEKCGEYADKQTYKERNVRYERLLLETVLQTRFDGPVRTLRYKKGDVGSGPLTFTNIANEMQHIADAT